MASSTIYPPIVDSYMPAFLANDGKCTVYFRLSKFNSSTDIQSVQATVTKQDTGMNMVDRSTDSNGRYRKTGIILDIKTTHIEDDLYSIEINDEDLISKRTITYYNEKTKQKETYIKNGWTPGWIYKIQLRLSSVNYYGSSQTQATWLNYNSNNFSEWSTVCTVKAIGEINYKIPNLSIDSSNTIDIDNITYEENNYESTTLNIVGSFERSDPSELIHSYRFYLYENNSLLEDSDEIYSNQQNPDDIKYLFRTELESDHTYQLGFKYETINKYIGGKYKENERYSFTCTSYNVGIPEFQVITAENPNFIIIDEETHTYYPPVNSLNHFHKENDESTSPDLENEDSSIGGSFDYNTNVISEEQEEGRVGLRFIPNEPEYSFTGNICVRRADSNSNFSEWTDILIYVCKNKKIDEIPIFYDYTIESGVMYKYGVQIIESGYRGSLRINETIVIRNFDYSFLLGKDNKQLKFKFDNEMNSFKYQIYDSKIDPIGSKYPMIARNANTYYRTFPLNGTISFNMDENGTFATKEDVFGDRDGSTIAAQYGEKKYGRVDYEKYYHNMIHYPDPYDYTYEKRFRDLVLDFLQDGEVKLFKSPTEGNILIRLMDINCSPTQSLGRLIYSFSSTAYEIDEATIENYIKYKLMVVGDWTDNFDILETKLGQINDYITISKDEKDDNNITKKIIDKYSSGGKQMANQKYKIKGYHHIKITFDDKPFRIKVGDGTNDYLLGNIMNFKGNTIRVLDPINIYEFDDLVYCNCENSPMDSWYILKDANSDNGPDEEQVHVTIDFLYDIIESYNKKKIKNRKHIKKIGQIFQTCTPNENLLMEIYLKYYLETEKEFCELDSFSSIDIYADPGTAFYVKDQDDDNYELHVIGETGRLSLIDISNIKGLYFLGSLNHETGEIEKVEKDVVMDYICIIRKGEYKEGKGE